MVNKSQVETKTQVPGGNQCAGSNPASSNQGVYMDAVKEATKIVGRYAIKQWINDVLGFLLIKIVVTLIVLGIAILIRM